MSAATAREPSGDDVKQINGGEPRQSPLPMHPRWFLFSAAVAALAIVGATASILGSDPYLAAGNSDPGRPAALLYALLRLVAAISGSITLGALGYSVFFTPPTSKWKVDVDGYSGLLVAGRSSLAWCVSAALLIPVSAADSAGISSIDALRKGAIWSLIEATEKPKAWIVVTILATAIAIGIRFALSWNAVLGLAGISAIAVLPPAVVGNAGEGPNHDLANGAVILFTIALSAMTGLSWCALMHLHRGGTHPDILIRRYRIAMALGTAVLAVTSAVLGWILIPAPLLTTTLYGRLALAATVLVLLANTATFVIWRLDRSASAEKIRNISRLSAVSFTTLFLATAAVLAMAIQPAPAFGTRPFTATDVLLGFDLPEPPSLATFLTQWRFDFVLGTASLVAAGMYVFGVVRLRRRGDSWSQWRTLAWTLGCAILLFSTSSGFAAYGYAMFSVHMTTHMALNMFIPVLLVLGAPVTLVLRTVKPAGKAHPPGPREWTLTFMHSRFTRVLSNPGVAISLFVVSLYGLYFSSLFDQLLRFHWGHILMNVHFLITGYLFYWAVIGIDPGPKKLPYLGKLGMLFAIMPFHAFFGIAVMSMNSVIGGDFYRHLMFELPWITDLEHDQWVGGAIAWGSSEVPILLVVGALLSQWSKQDRRVADRNDRHSEEYSDSELDAYNAMLMKLAQNKR